MTTPHAELLREARRLLLLAGLLKRDAIKRVDLIARIDAALAAYQAELPEESETIFYQVKWNCDYKVREYIDSLRAAYAGLKVENERAFQSLELCGVPRERAKNVANGIQVFMTRTDRERQAAESTIAELRADRDTFQKICVERADELSKADSIISELRAKLAEVEDKWEPQP